MTFERKRRNTTIIVGGGIMLLLALGYASAGFYCNTLIWLVFAAFLAWAVSSVAKEKGSETRTAAVILFVVLPLLFAALIPWPNQLGAENREPIFVDHLSYYTVYIVEDGSSQIVVSGYIANDGKGGGQATVRISAYGGPPANNTDPADIENAFKEAYVDTGWIEPGNSAQIQWECNLSYFNSYGQVLWEIIPVDA